jgi:hypothetical protein
MRMHRLFVSTGHILAGDNIDLQTLWPPGTPKHGILNQRLELRLVLCAGKIIDAKSTISEQVC